MSFGQIGNVSVTNPIGFLTPIGPREINEIPLDVVLEESVSHSVVITEHPIEVGTLNGVSRGTIADNAFVAPSVYTMRGAVSDTPISWRIFRSDKLTKYANSQGKTRSLSAYELLFREHFLKLIPFTLRTPFGDMENMLFRSFTVIRDQSTKHAIVFSAEMVQLQMVVPDSASIEPVSEADLIGDQAQTQAVGETDLGDVSLQEIP
jgi:hypothetical protein